MPQQTPIHLLMRFSDKLGFIDNTIGAHKEVIQKRGSTWLGKMGKTLGHDKVARLNRQCQKHVPTFLYLVQKFAKEHQVYCGKILEVRRTLPSSSRQLVPAYYKANGLEKYIRLWIKLSSLRQVSSLEINDYVIASSGSPALVTLGRSMAALFVLRSKDVDDGGAYESPEESHGTEESENDWDF